MSYGPSLIIALLASQTIAAAAIAGERTSFREPAAVVVSGQRNSGQHGTKVPTPLDRGAIAVDGAESSHGEGSGMWRPGTGLRRQLEINTQGRKLPESPSCSLRIQ